VAGRRRITAYDHCSPDHGQGRYRRSTEWYSSQVVRTSLTGENGTLGEQFFHVDWTAALTSPGQATMTGYVYNDYGQPAKDVQLKITVVNPNGEAVEHVIRPVRGLVPAEGRAYFSVQVPESPAPYRVTVASFAPMALRACVTRGGGSSDLGSSSGSVPAQVMRRESAGLAD
jgi:hypothetical protein